MSDARDRLTREMDELRRLERERSDQEAAEQEMAKRMILEIRPEIEAIENAIPGNLLIGKHFTYEPMKIRAQLGRRSAIFLQPKVDVTLTPRYFGRKWGYRMEGVATMVPHGNSVAAHSGDVISKDEAVTALAKHVATYLHFWGLKPK